MPEHLFEPDRLAVPDGVLQVVQGLVETMLDHVQIDSCQLIGEEAPPHLGQPVAAVRGSHEAGRQSRLQEHRHPVRRHVDSPSDLLSRESGGRGLERLEDPQISQQARRLKHQGPEGDSLCGELRLEKPPRVGSFGCHPWHSMPPSQDDRPHDGDAWAQDRSTASARGGAWSRASRLNPPGTGNARTTCGETSVHADAGPPGSIRGLPRKRQRAPGEPERALTSLCRPLTP